MVLLLLLDLVLHRQYNTKNIIKLIPDSNKLPDMAVFIIWNVVTFVEVWDIFVYFFVPVHQIRHRTKNLKSAAKKKFMFFHNSRGWKRKQFHASLGVTKDICIAGFQTH